MPISIKGPERLLNLTLALLYTKTGLTKQEILSSVQGYQQDYVPHGNNDSLSRKFERDKEALTETGIPWEMFTPPSEDGNNHESRYRISRERFEWPKQTEKLSEHQVMLLNLAGRAWNHNSMSSEAARGLFKLRALAEIGQSSEMIGLAPRIRTHHPAFSQISQAIDHSNVIEFGYRKPQSQQTTARRLQPWALKNIGGQWLVTGWDLDQKDIRNFLLQRIVPPEVTLGAETFTKPSQQQLDEADRLLQEHTDNQVALLRIQPGTRAWFHFGMDQESTTGETQKSLTYMDLYLLAAELRHFVNEIEVIEPQTLKEQIEAGFQQVASMHHD